MTTKSPLETVNPARREALKKLVIGSALAIPVVASFTMGGPAHAQNQGGSNQGGSNQGGSNQGGSNAAAIPTMGEMAMIGVGGALALAGAMTVYGIQQQKA